MSLILEALRKSEAERARTQVPGLHAPTPPPIVRRVAPVWGPWVAALVGAALLAGTWWIGRTEERGRAERPEAADVTQAATPSGPSALPRQPAPETVAVIPPEPAPPAPVVAPLPPRAEAPAIAPAPPPPAPVAAEPEPVELPPATPPADALPGLATLSPTERAALPALKVSMHVWHEDPARRFAIVDGQRVGEGALLPGGIVAEIRKDGVVLELQDGRRVQLARP